MMFQRLMWTNFFYYILAIRFYFSLSLNLTSHFSNFAEFILLQIPNAHAKYYEILPARSKILHNTTCKIANLCFELTYYFLTLQKNPITFEQGCMTFWKVTWALIWFKRTIVETSRKIVLSPQWEFLYYGKMATLCWIIQQITIYIIFWRM